MQGGTGTNFRKNPLVCHAIAAVIKDSRDDKGSILPDLLKTKIANIDIKEAIGNATEILGWSRSKTQKNIGYSGCNRYQGKFCTNSKLKRALLCDLSKMENDPSLAATHSKYVNNVKNWGVDFCTIYMKTKLRHVCCSFNSVPSRRS